MLQELFEKAYFARFRVELPEIRANLVNLNTSVIGVRPDVDLSRLIDPAGRAATLDDARREITAGLVRRRVARHAGLCQRKTAARRGSHGPAILEQMDATTVLEAGRRGAGDADGNILIEVGEEQ